jgi:hypothetical protein
MGAKGTANRIGQATVVALVVGTLAVAGCGTESPDSSTTDTTLSEPEPLPVGVAAQVGGAEVRVVEVWEADSVSNGLRRGRFLVASVELLAGDAQLVYSPVDWEFAPSGGATLGVYAIGDRDRLGFGTLEPGQSAGGWVAFDLGDQSGAGELRYTDRSGNWATWTVSSSAVTPTS